jgi:hypothetical protein
MLSDDWLRQGFQHGERIEVTNIVDYVIWTNNENDFIGVSVNFDEADDYHYDIEIKEWMKFLVNVLDNPDFEVTSKLFRNFLNDSSEIFAFQDALDFNQIKYDKIAFW